MESIGVSGRSALRVVWIWRSNFTHREIQTHLEVVFAAWSLLLFLDLTSSSSGFLVSCGSGVSRLSRPGVRRRWGSSRLFAGLLLSLVGAILEMVASSPW